MRNIHLEGKIVDMNQFMLVIDDESGRTFVRYNYRNLAKPVQKGDYVRIDNGEAVNYSGILQVKLPRNGSITPTRLDNPDPPVIALDKSLQSLHSDPIAADIFVPLRFPHRELMRAHYLWVIVHLACEEGSHIHGHY